MAQLPRSPAPRGGIWGNTAGENVLFMPRHRRIALILLMLVGLAPTFDAMAAGKAPTDKVSKADKGAAAATNEAAKQKFKDGAFDEAAELFMRVYNLVRLPSAVFNAARAREAAKKWEAARALYQLYLEIEKAPDGIADARLRLAAVDGAQKDEDRARLQLVEKQRAEQDLAKQGDETARKAKELAEAQQRAEERLKAERAKSDQTRKLQPGVTLLPAQGATNEESVRALQTLAQTLVAEAKAARIGDVHPASDYFRAESARAQTGTCDFHCQLGLVRHLGSQYAIATVLRQDGDQLRIRLVLWRTDEEGADAGQMEVTAWTLADVTSRAVATAGGLFNQVRAIGVEPTRETVDQLTIDSQPSGAMASVNEVDVGRTPVTMPISLGKHRIRLQKDGFQTRGGQILIATGGQRVMLQLPPEVFAAAAKAPPIAPPSQPPNLPLNQPLQPAERTAQGVQEPPAVQHPPPPVKKGFVSAPIEHPKPEQKAVRRDQQPPAAAGPGAASGGDQSVQTGLVLEGDASFAAIPSQSDGQLRNNADVALGVGALVHLGWGEDDKAPVVSLLLGLGYFQFAGLLDTLPPFPQASGPRYTVGVALPRVGGLAFTANFHQASLKNGNSDFSFTTVGAKAIISKTGGYFAVGFQARVASDRVDDLDSFGLGPIFQLVFEFGGNIGGVPLSR